MTTLEDLVSMAMFARVVEARSFTAAAKTLAVSKSVVSKRVAALEQDLGTRLLHRTTRRLSLTPEGARLHERCLRLLQEIDAAREQAEGAGDEPRGVLRVSSPIDFSDRFVADAVAAFVARYPKVQVELSVDNGLADLIADRIDVAVRLSAALESSSLVARRVATARKVVCASPAYLAAHGMPQVPDDLRGHACLRFTRLRPDVEWRFGSGRATQVIPVAGPISSDNAEALRRAALAGAGVLVPPRFQVEEDLAAGRLVPILEDFAVASLGVFVVYGRGAVVPAKVRRFVEHFARLLQGARL